MRAFILAIGLGLVVAACGGDDGGTSPSARIPTYAGNWSGQYLISGCTQSGLVALANICGTLGQSAPYAFSLTQSSRNVSGSFRLGSIQFPSTGGAIGQDGSLALSATSVSEGISITVNWALQMPASALTGTVAQRWTSTGLTGEANVTGSISNATKTASVPVPLSVLPKTLGGFVHAVAGR